MHVTRIFTFSAAHHLTKYKGACERPHGHTYRLAVTVAGKIQPNGLVLDFAELKKIIHEEIISKLDHEDLNNILENPSAENIAIWIWDKLSKTKKLTTNGLKLFEIKVWEGDNTFVSYDGN